VGGVATVTDLPDAFFLSSRRRHTRCYRDWSSDVCSSDLTAFWRTHPQCRRPPVCPHARARRAVPPAAPPRALPVPPARRAAARRSEERRVGKERRARGAAERDRRTTDLAETRMCYVRDAR